MLTERGIEERERRRWGHLPLLRGAFRNKRRPSYEWHTSVDDRIEDDIMRFFEMAAAAVELKGDVWDIANAGDDADVVRRRREVHDELRRLSNDIDGIAEVFRGLSRKLDELHGIIEEAERPTDSA